MNYTKNKWHEVRGLSRELESESIQGSGFLRDGNAYVCFSIIFKIKSMDCGKCEHGFSCFHPEDRGTKIATYQPTLKLRCSLSKKAR